jgi:sugar phosphate isomerase/epimerase
MPFNADRVVCSTITLRHLPLADALSVIRRLGFAEIDLGALPGVCDHVPYRLDDAAVADVADVVRASGLRVRSVNADIGDLNEPLTPAAAAERTQHLDLLLDLCEAIGARALVLPNGRQRHEPFQSMEHDLDRVADQLTGAAERAAARGLELWVEAPHLFRLCNDIGGSRRLYERLPKNVGAVCDVSHIVASGGDPRAFAEEFADRIRHVHLRDASAGYIHHSIGNGDVDFSDAIAALADAGYDGAFALELETRDIPDDQRADAALAAAEYVGTLLDAAPRPPVSSRPPATVRA